MTALAVAEPAETRVLLPIGTVGQSDLNLDLDKLLAGLLAGLSAGVVVGILL